jgi:hypothetical protein
MTFSKLTLTACVCVRCGNLAGVENSKEVECECECFYSVTINTIFSDSLFLHSVLHARTAGLNKMCRHCTENISNDTHIGTRHVILAKPWLWLPDDGFM